MARWTYAFSNGLYNDWHRQYEGLAGIDVDPECSFLMVEEQGAGADHPFLGVDFHVCACVGDSADRDYPVILD